MVRQLVATSAKYKLQAQCRPLPVKPLHSRLASEPYTANKPLANQAIRIPEPNNWLYNKNKNWLLHKSQSQASLS
jgi:hypothetical protein